METQLTQAEQFFAFMGCVAALVFSCLGAAVGTAKSGVGVCAVGVLDETKVYKSLVPVIMAGVLGIYGIIVSVLIISRAKGTELLIQDAMKCFSAGLCCGLSSLASGMAIGVSGEAAVKAYALSDNMFVGMVLIMVFAGNVGLYGMIIGIIVIAF